MSIELERDLEANIGEDLSSWAYSMNIEVIYLKLNVVGQRGWPDRLVMWRGADGGHLLFVELKRAGEQRRKLQKYIHSLIEKCGFEVETYDDKSIALEALKGKILSTQ